MSEGIDGNTFLGKSLYSGLCRYDLVPDSRRWLRHRIKLKVYYYELVADKRTLTHMCNSQALFDQTSLSILDA